MSLELDAVHLGFSLSCPSFIPSLLPSFPIYSLSSSSGNEPGLLRWIESYDGLKIDICFSFNSHRSFNLCQSTLSPPPPLLLLLLLLLLGAPSNNLMELYVALVSQFFSLPKPPSSVDLISMLLISLSRCWSGHTTNELPRSSLGL